MARRGVKNLGGVKREILRAAPFFGKGEGIWVLGAGVIREKIFGIPDNFSQGIPDDPANLFPVSPVPPTFELIL
jgi:hypothetical protein